MTRIMSYCMSIIIICMAGYLTPAPAAQEIIDPSLPLDPIDPGTGCIIRVCADGYVFDLETCKCIRELCNDEYMKEFCDTTSQQQQWQTYSANPAILTITRYPYDADECTCRIRHLAACAPGYWGAYTAAPSTSAAVGSITCTPCPDGGVSATPENNPFSVPNQLITDCFIPAGNTGADNTGQYTYTENCHYVADGVIISD